MKLIPFEQEQYSKAFSAGAEEAQLEETCPGPGERRSRGRPGSGTPQPDGRPAGARPPGGRGGREIPPG